MKIKAAVADWDGTLRPGFLLRDWLKFLSDLSVTKSTYVDDFDNLYHEYTSNRIGYEAFAEDAICLYGSAMNGVSAGTARSASSEFVTQDLHNIYRFVEPFCSLMRSLEIKVIIISGAPSIVLEAYKNHIKLDMVYSIDIKVGHDGLFTHEFVHNFATRRNKRKVINDLISQNTDILFALGDAISDIPLLNAAKYAFVISDLELGRRHTLNGIAQVVRPSQILPKIIKITNQMSII